MPKQRVHSDGQKYIIPESKITRRLDAITEFVVNKVEYGCEVSPISGSYSSVIISAGAVIMNNIRRTVATIALNVGSYNLDKFATVYIPSTGIRNSYAIVPTVAMVSTAIASSWCPDQTQQSTATSSRIPAESLLLAHIYHVVGSAVATTINNNVKPDLYFDVLAWQKDNSTDIDTAISALDK